MRISDWSPDVCSSDLGNLSVKLMRTFTAQIEALTKLRRGGEQVVRHIHVDNSGGQAVITETVQTGGSRNGKVADHSQDRKSVVKGKSVSLRLDHGGCGDNKNKK